MDAETHNIPHGENIREDIQWGSGGWEAEVLQWLQCGVTFSQAEILHCQEY
jgi:hypothetical protein